MKVENIGKTIAERRRKKGLTQEALGEKLGVSSKSISRWETGKTLPDISIYEEICEVLDMSIAEFLYDMSLMEAGEKRNIEKNAINLFSSKRTLENMGIMVEILIFIGIVMTTTCRMWLSEPKQIFIIVIMGTFVWGFGFFMKIKIRKTVNDMEKREKHNEK